MAAKKKTRTKKIQSAYSNKMSTVKKSTENYAKAAVGRIKKFEKGFSMYT